MDIPDIHLLKSFYDLEPQLEKFGEAVDKGLNSENKSLPSKFFYDGRGSLLFDKICKLQEYYLTRTEVALLNKIIPEFFSLIGNNLHLIEFGSGSSKKVKILLSGLQSVRKYTAIDISRDHLRKSTIELARKFPKIQVTAICADYTKPMKLPASLKILNENCIIFFPGSSIGNFSPFEAVRFLKSAIRLLEKTSGGLLIGVDLKKDEKILKAAYNDPSNVTAAFNLNLLYRANKELGANFKLSQFSHEACYNQNQGCIEMYLISQMEQNVLIGNKAYSFAVDEKIHTENSYKYDIAEFCDLAKLAGLDLVKVWTDPKELYSLHFYKFY